MDAVDPIALLTNVQTFLMTLLVPLAFISALVGAVVYIAAKQMDNPGMVRWAHGAWAGAAVGFGAPAIVGLIRFAVAKVTGLSA